MVTFIRMSVWEDIETDRGSQCAFSDLGAVFLVCDEGLKPFIHHR